MATSVFLINEPTIIVSARRLRRHTLTVEGSIVSGPTANDALGHLEAHGIAATEKTVGAHGQRPGEVILATARAQGADLLIKGAYTQSRLRQLIFGGATRHILAAASCPCSSRTDDTHQARIAAPAQEPGSPLNVSQSLHVSFVRSQGRRLSCATFGLGLNRRCQLASSCLQLVGRVAT